VERDQSRGLANKTKYKETQSSLTDIANQLNLLTQSKSEETEKSQANTLIHQLGINRSGTITKNPSKRRSKLTQDSARKKCASSTSGTHHKRTKGLQIRLLDTCRRGGVQEKEYITKHN
jgi:hypothetical protein